MEEAVGWALGLLPVVEGRQLGETLRNRVLWGVDGVIWRDEGGYKEGEDDPTAQTSSVVFELSLIQKARALRERRRRGGIFEIQRNVVTSDGPKVEREL